MRIHALDPRRASVAAKLFLTCWLVYGLHFATNIVREHYPAFSLAERGTLRVDPYLGLHPDLFEIEGRGAFINNNPGASLLGGIAYTLARPAVDWIDADVARRRAARNTPLTAVYNDHRPNRTKFFRQVRERGLDIRFGLASLAIQLLCMAPISALSAVLMRRVLLRSGFGDTTSLWLALVYAFGTPLFFRTGHLNHNLIVAQTSFFAFALLYRPGEGPPSDLRLGAAGALAGFALVCDYSGAFPLAALGIWALVSLWAHAPGAPALRKMGWMVAGGTLPVLGLLLYQYWAFGNPLSPAQSFMPATQYSGYGWNGLDWPALDLMASNLFDLRYGLFAFGPILLLALATPWLARNGQSPIALREIALALGLTAALLLFESANQFARLQWNTGFRMLAPCVPFLFLIAAPTIARLPVRLSIAVCGLAIAHSWCLAMVREDVVLSLTTVLGGGLRLPWLTVLSKMGKQYVPFLEQTGPQAWPLFLVLAVALGALWWTPRASDSDPKNIGSRLGVADESHGAIG